MASAVICQVLLVVFLLLFGTCNILLLQFMSRTTSRGQNKHGSPKEYHHPFVQGTAIFIGEFLCIFVYWLFKFTRPSSTESTWVPVSKWLLFLPAALLNIIGTTTIYVGLNLTYAASFQMFSGAVVVFTGLLSVAFLGRSIRVHMWIGIAVLTVALLGVGLAGALFNGVQEDANGIVSGDLLIILAQIILSAQYVYEEKYLKKHNVPASLAAGLEGLFGGLILGVMLVPMYYIPASKPFSLNPGHLEDVWDALAQMNNNWRIIAATVGLMASASISIYCGVKVTKELSATTRTVVDSGRLLLVWIVSLSVRWQPFEYRSFLVELVGYALLVVGMMIYLDLVFRPFLIRHHYLKNTHQSGTGDDSSELVDSNDNDDRERLIIPRD